MSEDLITDTTDIHREIGVLSDHLNSEYADQIENHMAHPHIASALGELSLHPVMEGDSEVTYIPASEFEANESIDALIERTKVESGEQAREAIERSQFKGVEVEEAITSYYQDHNVALTLVGKLIEGAPDEVRHISELSSDKLDIQSDILRSAIQTLSKAKAGGGSSERINELTQSVLSALFTEPSVGQLTLEKPTIDELAAKIGDLSQKVGDTHPSSKESIAAWMESAINDTKKEVRVAGQLLFHNTLFGFDVLEKDTKTLQSQAKQHKSSGMGSQTPVRVTTTSHRDSNGAHGSNIHWTEVYDPAAYKRPNRNTEGYNPDARFGAMTFAIPLAEVISKAPYGRGLKYATVSGVPGAHAVAPGGNLTGNIGVGAPEILGSGFGAIDRVFWGSDKNYEDAIDYEIPINGDSVTRVNPETGQRESTTYIIQSDNDQLTNYVKWRDGVEGGTPEDDELQQLANTQSERKVVSKYGGVTSSADLPTIVTIQDLDIDESKSVLESRRAGNKVLGARSEMGTWQRQAGFAEIAIRKIEEESTKRFEGQFVVPLRATRPSFMNVGDNMVRNFYGDRLLTDIRRVYS